MFPQQFYPRPHRFIPDCGLQRAAAPAGPDHRYLPRMPAPWDEPSKHDKWNKDEEVNSSHDIPFIYTVQSEFKHPPPLSNKTLPDGRSNSPVFVVPPPKHFMPHWSSSGRVSPAADPLSPSGHYYPNPSSPRPSYQSTTSLHPMYGPTSPSLFPVYAPPSPSLSYFSGKSSARKRTLIEIPRHDNGPNTLKTDTLIPRKVSVSESTLDPNSRPFTPSGRYHTSSLCTSDTGSVQDDQSYERDLYVEHAHYEDIGDEPSEQFDFQWEYDPLPEDPMSLLPDLETSLDDPNNNNNCINNNNNNPESIQQPRKVKPLLPPLVPEIAWKTGNLRPPLLPTPVNFPPFGPSRLEPLFFRTNIFSDNDNCGKLAPESRLLVSGVEKTLSLLAVNVHNSELKMPDSIEKQRMCALGEQVEPAKVIEMPQLPPPSFSTGGIFSQNLSVPAEYLMSQVIGDRIKPINIRQEHTDLLFFLFYTLHGDALQLVAASLLFERGWRYHKQDRIWLARWPGVKPEEKTVSFEKGLYQYFDMVSWKRIPGWFRLDYCHLAEKTLVPEDLKTLYTRFSGLMREITIACARNLILSGFTGAEALEEFDKIDGVKFMSCII